MYLRGCRGFAGTESLVVILISTFIVVPVHSKYNKAT